MYKLGDMARIKKFTSLKLMMLWCPPSDELNKVIDILSK